MHRVAVAPVLLLALLAGAAWSQVPAREPVKEGDTERLVLDDGADTDAATWTPAECVVSVDKKHAKRGDTALRLHIDVNWSTGEKAYPIGWPRMNRKWPEGARDWAQYDFLEFSIYTETSRAALPNIPLGFILYNKEGKNAYTRELTELKPGQWVDYRMPVAQLGKAIPCSGMQFYIAESNYKDGDVLDFWIDNISLTRYTVPTVAASGLAEGAITTTSAYLTTDLNLMGVRPGQTGEVVWQVAKGGKTSATGKLTALAGRHRYYLTLPEKGLSPGVYDVTLKCGNETPTAIPLLVVPSPWQEASK